ncbi:MAG: hypothetical protein ACXVEF_28685 [Polyangiales bacterium]
MLEARPMLASHLMQDRTLTSGYGGPDRRRHKLYVTHNTEYHTRDGICVAVRDRGTGQWIENHKALGHKMSGALHTPRTPEDFPFRAVPQPGDQVVFDNGRKHHVITSEVERITRPPREIVAIYPN